MRRLHDDHGALSAEQVGVLILVAALVAALWSVGFPRRVEEVAEQAVDCLFQPSIDGCEIGDYAGDPDAGTGNPGTGDDDRAALEAAVDQLPDGSQIIDEATGDVLWTSGDGLTGDPEIDAILTTLAQFNDHVREMLGRDSLDDAGLPLIVNLNVRTGSAYWDPREDSDHYLQTAYRQGWALPHVIAHEFGHGIVHFLVDFHEKGHTTDEQRSMNEGLADIISFNITGVADRENPDTGEVYRSMRDPGAHDQPAHVGDFDLDSGCGMPPCIHSNSSIVSHAYYLIVEGTGGNDGLGLDSAQRIFYEALPRMDTHSDLAGYRDVMLAAAADLHGTNSTEYRRVQTALDAVGLDADFEGV